MKGVDNAYCWQISKRHKEECSVNGEVVVVTFFDSLRCEENLVEQGLVKCGAEIPVITIFRSSQAVFPGAQLNQTCGAAQAAHKVCVYSVTMRVHARARCDAHHTMHVAHTHMHAAWSFWAKAASFFFF